MKNYNGADNTSEFIETFSIAARPTLSIDAARYQAYLDGEDLTPEQKDEFLQDLWSVIVAFVELGYGVHPLQEACGKDGGGHDQGPQTARNRLNSGNPEKPTY